jgi:dinuclear metal center YbgI/SA1388 family protein
VSTLDRVVAYLDDELRTGDFDDSSHNGLQVGGPDRVRRVCCGVDASMEFFVEARERRADLLVCHHGISWGDSLKRITGLNYERLAFLIRNDMALYASHLPLDAHPRYGNNAGICRALGLQALKPFGLYRGVEIGFAGRLPKPLPYARFKKLIAKAMGGEPRTMDFGKRTIRTVAVVSGGAAAEVEEAGRKGFDAYVSGEPALMAYSLAQEYGINAVFAGHYATEVFGVKTLAEQLEGRFKLKAEFIDLRVPF